MIRVLQVVVLMTAGGIETLLMNLYRQIDRTKVQFDFLVQKDEKGFYDNEILALGGRIFRVNKLNILNQKEFKESIIKILKNNPDITVVHSHNNLLSCFVMRAAYEAGVEKRISHGHIARPRLMEFKQIIRFCIRPYAIKLIKEYSTHRFACSDLAGDWLYGKGLDYKFFPNAIDLNKFRFDPEKRRKIREEYNASKQKIYGHVGRFSAQKNHKKILRIFAEICKTEKDSYLWLIGEGELENKLKESCRRLMITDRVLFLGVKTNVQDFYSAMDVFIFPSYYEGLPVTVVETQANGLHSVISDNITRQVIITNLVDVENIKETNCFWATKCMMEAQLGHHDSYGQIKDSIFRIEIAAQKLENFYLN
ncbi:glycosyltransferase family 1 protein [Acetobacterium wieringae]|uniref:glycosyltransferase family 1 protein n=1 Tax=Acetobacterium wieringae TaxID=52694 RepID=UPI0031596989